MVGEKQILKYCALTTQPMLTQYETLIMHIKLHTTSKNNAIACVRELNTDLAIDRKMQTNDLSTSECGEENTLCKTWNHTAICKGHGIASSHQTTWKLYHMSGEQ